MDYWINQYLLNIKKVRNFSQNTMDSYYRDLCNFQEYLVHKSISFKEITKEDVWDYLKFLDEAKYSNSSISRQVSAIRSFYQYLKENHVIASNILKTIRNPKIKKSLPQVLNFEEVHILLDFEEAQNAWQQEEILIFEMLYATGLRVSELVGIKLADISLKEQSIRVMGKGQKERIVFYGSYAKDALDKFFRLRQELLKHGEIDYLFVNQRGGKLSRSSVEGIVERRIRKIALEKHISPHTLRHTFATHMLENGANIRTVQELLGHEKLGTTEIYTHITPEYLRKEYRMRLPRK